MLGRLRPMCVWGVYFRWSVSHALYRLACKLLALFVLASPLREQGPSNRVRYETPAGLILGPSLSRVVPSLQRAILSLQLTMTISQACYVYNRPLIRLAQGQPGLDTVYVHSTVYLATHSSPLCVRFHTRGEAVSYGGCRSSHMEVPTRVRFMCGSLSVK
jgi:hypothetical protein